jgi:CubicO group peptidase (beta-lactamase class C family)
MLRPHRRNLDCRGARARGTALEVERHKAMAKGSLWPRTLAPGAGGPCLLVVCALVLLGASARAAGPVLQRLDGSPLAPVDIDAAVTRLMGLADVTGVGLALFDKGAPVFLKAYGFRDTEKRLALTPDSVMTAASLTKSAFATVVMQLVEEGRLDLDKRVIDYLPRPLPEYPAYKDLADDARYKLLTLRMLLSHTSGFPNWRSFNDNQKLNINFEPGSRFAYSGEGIQLAQLVVETVTKKPLTVLMRERLFFPDGMRRTSLVWERRFESDFANGYDAYGRSLGPERRRTADAAGSMQTTLRDYASFLREFLQGRTLRPKTREEMLSPQVRILSKHEFPSLSTETTTENDAIRLSYGLGWGLYWTPYGRAFFKEGHDEGWRHYCVCFDASGKGLLLMTNSSNGEGIFPELLKTLLGNPETPLEWEGFTPYQALPPRVPLKQHAEVALARKLLQSRVGRYRISAAIVLTFTRAGSRLYVQENDEPKQELGAESDVRFFSKSSDDDAYTFQLDGQGRPKAVVLHAGDKDFVALRE